MNKSKFKNFIVDILLAILAGLSISIGCIAFLSCGNKIIGSLFFTVGLFVILTLNLNLFTGKICYSLENDKSYITKLIIIWLGNFIGATLSAILLRLTRLNGLIESCKTLCETKTTDGLLSLFILGIFCNILIFVAVDGFKNGKEPWIKVLSLFFGVSIFVLCGFEHCVADMFYFAFAGFTWKSLLCIFIVTLGNIIGGLLIPLVKKLIGKITKKDV